MKVAALTRLLGACLHPPLPLPFTLLCFLRLQWLIAEARLPLLMIISTLGVDPSDPLFLFWGPALVQQGWGPEPNPVDQGARLSMPVA